jgi:hypothetical protein
MPKSELSEPIQKDTANSSDKVTGIENSLKATSDIQAEIYLPAEKLSLFSKPTSPLSKSEVDQPLDKTTQLH